MRLVITLAVTAMMAIPAFAKPSKPTRSAKSQFNGKLLTYNQLMSLSKAKRQQYIRDLTELLVYFESFNSKHEVAQLEMIKKIREQIAMLSPVLAVLPQAEAASSEYEDDKSKYPADISKCEAVHDGNYWNCGEACRFDSAAMTCVVDPTYMNWDNSKGITSALTGYLSKTCPKGSEPVPSYLGNGAKLCIPEASWKTIDAGRKEVLAKGEGFVSPANFRKHTKEQQYAMIHGVEAAKKEKEQNELNNARAVEEHKSQKDKPVNPAIAGTKEEPAKPQDKCEPIAMDCKALKPADLKAARERFQKVASVEGIDGNICIAGGFPSRYSTATKEPGTCEVNALKKKYEAITGGCEKGTDGKEKKALCNPVLFCLGFESEGEDKKKEFNPLSFCVNPEGGNANITNTCAEEYNCALQGMRYRDGKCRKGIPVIPGAENKDKIPRACDISEMDIPASEMWQELVRATEQLRDVWCNKSEDFKMLFCRECEIVNDKIYTMNKKVTGSGCAPEPVKTTPSEPSKKGDRLPIGKPDAVKEKNGG